MENGVYVNEDTRTIYLCADIDAESAAVVNSTLLEWTQVDQILVDEKKEYDPMPISLFIDSMGGNIYDALGIISMMNASMAPIITYCLGYCFSAAFIIFINGDIRIASKYATFLYHSVSTFKTGKYKDVVDDVKEMDSLMAIIEDITAEHTDIPMEDLKLISDRKEDRIFHGEEAILYGIADEILPGKGKNTDN